MKKLLLGLFLVLSSLCFGEIAKPVIYDVNNKKQMEQLNKEQKKKQMESMKRDLAKMERYKELSNKESLSGKEVEEMMQLKEEIMQSYLEAKKAEEEERVLNTIVTENDVLNNLSRKPTAEELKRAQEDRERKQREQSETTMDKLLKKIF